MYAIRSYYVLDNLDAAGFPKDDLLTLQKLVDMEKSDLYDVFVITSYSIHYTKLYDME